jgi:hypothetical protein
MYLNVTFSSIIYNEQPKILQRRRLHKPTIPFGKGLEKHLNRLQRRPLK